MAASPCLGTGAPSDTSEAPSCKCSENLFLSLPVRLPFDTLRAGGHSFPFVLSGPQSRS